MVPSFLDPSLALLQWDLLCAQLRHTANADVKSKEMRVIQQQKKYQLHCMPREKKGSGGRFPVFDGHFLASGQVNC